MPTRKKKRKIQLKVQVGRLDFWLAGAVFLLTCFGILMVYDASAVVAFRDFRDKYYFLKLQALWGAIGFLVASFLTIFDYRRFFHLSPILFLMTIVLLLLVFVPGLSVQAYGARRWLNLGIFSPQPSELAKLSLVLYLSAWLSKKRSFSRFLVLVAIPLGLILLGKDLGTAAVALGTSFSLYFLSGAPWSHFLMLIPIAVLGFIALILRTPYRLKRVMTFLNPTQDPLGASYHARQILIALGSGGLMGLGIGQSRQKYEYLPESFTDSIFAIISEEVGFIGAMVMILVYLFVFWRGLKIAKNAPDSFGQLLAGGITSWLAIQTFINLAAMVVLVPLTGIPLPFVSYGGSNLVVSMAGMGILLNISKRMVKK
jgi:cell division protein FtsW